MVLLRSLSLDEKGGPSLLPPETFSGERADGEPCPDEGHGLEGEDVDDDNSGAFLPDHCIKLVQAQLITGEAPGVALLHLLSMASVCKQWRMLASELSSGSAIAFDGFDNLFSSQPCVQKFRRLSSQQKEQVFYGGARLLTGYANVTLSGDGITDRVLNEVAKSAGSGLTRCRVHSSSHVTDSSLSAVVQQAKDLETLELEDLSFKAAGAGMGKFLALVFERCEKLTTLHLSNIPSMNWGACKAAAMVGPDKAITKLHVRGVNLDTDFGVVLSKLPHLQELEIDGPARNIRAAATSCPSLHRVSYQVSSRTQLDEALSALMTLKELRQLELIVKNFTLCSDQLRVIGMLSLVELRLDSYIYKQQPTLSRSSYSHVDNEGVKALVDSICNRWCAIMSDMRPLKLSLCGATALTHDAVSALLRLPILTELDIGGCCRIIAMDKMRLVAKVRAGREMLESGRRPSMRSTRFPGLVL
uniref:F-box domain-containing protein n=1 Tax=Chlamydomonas leiostraca TaxID=1034604 RepID=A0A7S0RZ38_9CHLO|mmetsp:Transcript_34727/g.87872  ORF Transcript_34727/g.87872 Transcript_34727/m.87872 type:complete len:473 (+) Transcript_34727:89-1507(+)|eukprot:CAMPEP_0202865136 /NCGR_PEP_ID=MMETSP1391-20130828/5295_1 /ASSEMBLY_ACC=CAM_ASM_000867 /TAXON_ID=1034604 /ORGANISM="Chlamydomonas leiostraca, Strain SAG 11-49" /LENGTH=472 /DNA_ID=CAMNT_0049544937 /DNA_START=80 /DNA_END=1498 /DNA_ORIENTATION=-